MMLFVPFLVIAVLLALIRRPLSRDYAIVGVGSYFICENSRSVTSFVPLGGAGVIKSINGRPLIEFV
jgi:hypothetical protein